MMNEERTKRRCKVCNKNYEEDNKIVLDNMMCTSCTIKDIKDAVGDLKADPWEDEK